MALSDGGAYQLPFRGYSVLTNSIDVPTYGYGKDPVTAREFNDLLVENGDSKAMKRKIEALLGRAKGCYRNVDGSFEINLTYGYKEDLVAAREFNNLLVEKGVSGAKVIDPLGCSPRQLN